eukprot:Pgem_evm4s12679
MKQYNNDRFELIKESFEINNLIQKRKLISELINNIKKAIKESITIRDDRQVNKIKSNITLFCTLDSCQEGILDDKGICMACESLHCLRCGLQKPTENEHECLQDNVDSVDLIRRTSKPCPRCKRPIIKIEGCAQMFCTECYCPFDWVTGRIITNTFFHNPEYVNMLRENPDMPNIFEPMNEDDGPCDQNRIYSFNQERHNKIHEGELCPDCEILLFELIRKIMHIYDIDIGRLDRLISYSNRDFNIRYKYLSKKITKKQYGQRLYANEKCLEKNIAIRELFQIYCFGISDILFTHDSRYFKDGEQMIWVRN